MPLPQKNIYFLGRLETVSSGVEDSKAHRPDGYFSPSDARCFLTPRTPKIAYFSIQLKIFEKFLRPEA
jgi:hypothetical protein